MSMDRRGTTDVQVKDAAPCFLVPDVRITAEHYRDVLGFCPGDLVGEPPTFCMVFRGGATLVLQKGAASPNGGEVADVFIGVTDVKAIDGGVSFSCGGDLDPVVKALARHHVTDLEVSRPTLEEVFLGYYEGAEDEGAEKAP